jgi:ABC-2 type transport system ATP-binding protein
MEKFVIQIEQLKKIFSSKEKGEIRQVEAVSGIDLEVFGNEIFGLLGPNGAGKTTVMRMLCTLLVPTSGTARVVGFNLHSQSKQIRENIGYVSQRGGMEKRLTGRENLMLQGRLYGLNKKDATVRVSEIIDRLEMTAFADRRASTYSGGQKRIFDLASGVMHKPTLLFLDEPTTGLDPHSRARVWEEVKKLHEEGTAIFLTTHYLEEADVLCDRIAIIDYGKIVSLGAPSQLKLQISGDVITLGLENYEILERAIETIRNESYVKEIQQKDELLHLFVERGDGVLPLIMKKMHDRNIPIKSIQLAHPTLDDVFLKLTGKTMRESEGNE